MNLTELEIELSVLTLPKEAHSSETLCNRLAHLVREDNWDELSRLYPKIGATIKAIADESGKDECIDLLRTLASEEATRTTETIRQSIRGATSFHVQGSLAKALLQLHERAEAQNLRSNLLAVAFADRLTDLVFPAADRAAELTNLIVRQQPSPEAEKYLEEACFCYFYALYSASAVMCRSVLEEVLRTRLTQLGHNGANDTLSSLIHVAQRLQIIPPDSLHECHRVKDLGNRAAHGDTLGEEHSSECLAAARHALTCILTARN